MIVDSEDGCPSGHSDISPIDLGAYSSRTTLMGGNALANAAQAVVEKMHGQVEDAIVMGTGETIMEDTLYDKKGHILNPDLHSYLIMTIKDAPEIFRGLVDSYEPRGPYGAKEIGEGTTLPVLGAVAHAIANATGVWIKELPITPEKILKAIRDKQARLEAVEPQRG
jgi:CO/xanthine dehydrogenase Mo-binding subunit